MTTRKITRRTVLRGLGTAVALPLLETMRPLAALQAGAADSAALPLRMAFVYVPNGATMEKWTPKRDGADFDLPPILEPLAGVREHVQVLTGLAHRRADPNGDGAGDHARALATFLTGAQARKTAAADVRVGVSVDQVAAAGIGHLTRFPSLELGCDKGRQAGACDSGYSCAYQFNLAWKTPTLPLPPEVDPRLAFERLFGGGSRAESEQARAALRQDRRSVLDFVLDDARRLRGQISGGDARRLDEYLASVREVEQQLERREAVHVALPPDAARFDDPPETYRDHVRLMFDLLALAFQTDSTRIATFMIAHDGSNRSYPFVGVPEGHHDLSHHGGQAEKKAKIARINRFHLEQFAYFLERLRSIREGAGTLLDQCQIVYGSGISDGNRHWHHDLPVLLAGRAGGTLRPGRHVRYDEETPMTNLYRAMLERMGTPVAQLGDSTGVLSGLA
jgi:hypothetical protein